MRERATRKRHNARDVAKLAGVSVATVSRVLNNTASVSAEAREKVDSAIQTLQFVPSSSARAINSGRTHLVGALVPTVDNAIFARFIDAIEEELNTSGLSLIVATTAYDPDRELDKTRRLLNIGVEGLFVTGITRNEAFYPLVKRHQVPVIATSYFDETHEFPTIGYNNRHAASQAWSHLVALGHRKIAVLSGPRGDSDRTRSRLSAFDAVTAGTVQVFETQLDYASAALATNQVLKEMPEATAFLCLSDILAQGVMLQLAAKGVRVPTDVSVIGIDDLQSSRSFHPPLTSIHLPAVQMGKDAAQAMSRWIETGEVPEPQELKSTICVRASTGNTR